MLVLIHYVFMIEIEILFFVIFVGLYHQAPIQIMRLYRLSKIKLVKCVKNVNNKWNNDYMEMFTILSNKNVFFYIHNEWNWILQNVILGKS